MLTNCDGHEVKAAHDNETLFDMISLKTPMELSVDERTTWFMESDISEFGEIGGSLIILMKQQGDDASYVESFTTKVLMIGPSQTTDVLIKAGQPDITLMHALMPVLKVLRLTILLPPLFWNARPPKMLFESPSCRLFRHIATPQLPLPLPSLPGYETASAFIYFVLFYWGPGLVTREDKCDVSPTDEEELLIICRLHQNMPAALLAGESWDTRDFDQRDNGCVEACGVFDPIRFSSGFNAVEQNKDTLWREVLQLIAHPDFHCPHKPSRVLDIASEYVKRTQVIVNELLKGVSENFGFKSSYLNKELNFDSSFRLLAVNYCPFLPDFDLARGLMPHTDHGVLTLLYENDVSSLEVFHNGKWVVMSGVPNAFLVLNADHLETELLNLKAHAEKRSKSLEQRADAMGLMHYEAWPMH
ncbi:DMR6-like oxygenase 2-like protein [Tanacetum coccineum]